MFKWLCRLTRDTSTSHCIKASVKSKIYTFWVFPLLFGIFICWLEYLKCGNIKQWNYLYRLCHVFLTKKSHYNLDLKSEMEKTRKLSLKKDTRASDSSQEDAIDQWARRRKQFKDSKKCSSTGGSSINSTITEGSSEYFSINYTWDLSSLCDWQY